MTYGNGASILLLEDEVLIAIDVETCLRDAGFNVAGSFSSCAKALEWLDNRTPDIAVVDVCLRDGVCIEVVRVLNANGVPFIVYSGMSYDPEAHSPWLTDAKWMSKPSEPADIIAAIGIKLAKKESVRPIGVSTSLLEGDGADPNLLREEKNVNEPKRRIQLTKEQKRVQMEEVTRIAFEEAERHRVHNSQKTERLRALRLKALKSEGIQAP